MRRTPRITAVLLAALALSASLAADAGQVRITLSSISFTPANVNVNVGDQVVWVWNGSGHTVTSGTDGSLNGSGRFRSGTTLLGTGSAYSWKATAGSGAYYCQPHFPTMSGTLNIVASGATTAANFRITEVEFAASGGLDRVQITNFGPAGGLLGRYRVSSASGTASTITTDPSVAASAAITLHLNATGTNTNADYYFPAHPELQSAGSFALYVGNTTLAAQGSLDPAALDDPDQLVDYVEWGTPGQAAQPNQATAIAAGYWTAGTAVNTTGELPGGAAGYSIVFCGSASDRGAGFWQVARPNFGTQPTCSTPAKSATWGRIKSLYR